MMEEAFYWFWLCGISVLGNKHRKALIQMFDTPRAVFELDIQKLEQVPFLNDVAKKTIIKTRNPWSVEAAYTDFVKAGYHFTYEAADDYPDRLKPLPDSPMGLYYAGRLPVEENPTIAIVGARSCSGSGRSLARHFGTVLSEAGIQVVSGMALGIDGAAHRGALEAGKDTYAVIGSGLDICYPKENRDIYEILPKCGGIISEYPLGEEALSWHFPMRNRLIAGFADSVLVVEARKRSGSLITADLALEQGKDVLAVPGRSTDALSEGCLDLIRSGAKLVTKPEDVLEDYALENVNLKKNNICLDKLEELVYSSLCLNPKYIEDICTELHIDISEGMAVMYKLEHMGLIRQVYRGQYVRNSLIL